MYRKFDLLTGVPIYEVDEPFHFELCDEEAHSWMESHGIFGACANSCISKILKNMYVTESFAEASARCGYGNVDNDKLKQWYYDRGILILTGEEVQDIFGENYE